jgi:hypothetical protein
LRFRLTLDDAYKLYQEKQLKDRIQLPVQGWIEYGVELHEGLNQAEFIGTSLVLKIAPFDIEEIEKGEESVFSSRIRDTAVDVVVEVDRLSQKKSATKSQL